MSGANSPGPSTERGFMDGQSQTGFLGHILAWFAHPFQSEGSAFNWVLFVGLLIIAAWMWNFTLLQITKEL